MGPKPGSYSSYLSCSPPFVSCREYSVWLFSSLTAMEEVPPCPELTGRQYPLTRHEYGYIVNSCNESPIYTSTVYALTVQTGNRQFDVPIENMWNVKTLQALDVRIGANQSQLRGRIVANLTREPDGYALAYAGDKSMYSIRSRVSGSSPAPEPQYMLEK